MQKGTVVSYNKVLVRAGHNTALANGYEPVLVNNRGIGWYKAEIDMSQGVYLGKSVIQAFAKDGWDEDLGELTGDIQGTKSVAAIMSRLDTQRYLLPVYVDFADLVTLEANPEPEPESQNPLLDNSVPNTDRLAMLLANQNRK